MWGWSRPGDWLLLDLTEKEVNNICKPDPYVEVPGTQPQLGLNERIENRSWAEYIRLAKSYDDKAFQVADKDSRRESPYGNQKVVNDQLDLADRFYEMAGTTREEQA